MLNLNLNLLMVFNRKLSRLNRSLFRGFPVLCRIDDEVVINTDFLEIGGMVISPQHVSPSYQPIDALNIVDIEEGKDALSPEQLSLSQEQLLHSSRERVMIVKIPDDRSSGSMFVVRTPDGITRTVSILFYCFLVTCLTP